MRRFVFCFVFLCCAFCYQAQAIVPLEIKATLQLPSPANPWEVIPWDIQHCADDTSFGYAYVVGDTICWAARLGDVERQCIIPRDSFRSDDSWWCWEGGLFHHKLKLFHLTTQGDHLCALLQSETRDCYWIEDNIYFNGNHVFSLFDLESEQLLRKSSIEGSHTGRGRYDNSEIRTIGDLVLWPPFPDVSIKVIFAQNIVYDNHLMGDIYIHSTQGMIYAANLQTNTLNINTLTSGIQVVPFVDFSQFLFVTNNYYYRSESHEFSSPGWCVWETSSRMGTISLGASPVISTLIVCSLNSDSLICPSQLLYPQRDENGTNRIISSGAYAVSATQFSDTIWHNSAITGPMYTARLSGCNDEQVLSFNVATRKFGVFSGIAGEYLDSTSAIAGTVSYIIKQPNHTDEFVTLDATRLVRVYGSRPSFPQNVVCQYLPADSMIQLSWSPVFGATSYYVFSRPFCSETEEEWIGEVAGDTTCLVPISYTRECFRVSAVAQ